MIGLIFGETNFPKAVLKKIKKIKIKYLIIDLTKTNSFKKDKHSHKVTIGQFGKIISVLKQNRCNKVLFAGKVNKPNFSELKLDFKGVYYLSRIVKSSKIGDAAILKEIIKILKEEKIVTVNSITFNAELALTKGHYSNIKPDQDDLIDIKIAIKKLNQIGKYNNCQAAVARNGKIIAIEGNGGTEKMLRKCKDRHIKNKGVLVKLPKRKQDLRIDLPTVGLKTLIQCKSSGLKGIVLKSKQNIFLEKEKCIKFANKNKMFITIK